MLNSSHSPASGDKLKPLETSIMWKLVVGFLAFAALALFVIFKAGDSVDMGGEKHGSEAAHEVEPAKAAPAAPAAEASAAAPASK